MNRVKKCTLMPLASEEIRELRGSLYYTIFCFLCCITFNVVTTNFTRNSIYQPLETCRD
jgi:hypothetical protein